MISRHDSLFMEYSLEVWAELPQTKVADSQLSPLASQPLQAQGLVGPTAGLSFLKPKPGTTSPNHELYSSYYNIARS